MPNTRIRNVAALTDEQICVRLRRSGISVHRTLDRQKLIDLAREHGLWGSAGNVIQQFYKKQYGRKQKCGDEISIALEKFLHTPQGDVDPSRFEQLAAENNVDPRRWDHLNIGMRVMSLSNILRAKARRGERTVIGSTVWNDESMLQ